uniref:Transposable element P transposase-like RNase H C-terminal domain-containing protein n=1 Tax=Amphimedon queenslandica TaxID=400682 RepID=A0A1X7V416_AMPQE
VMIFFSRRICQDPLEKFFRCQRQIGRIHDNPNVKEFQQNTQTLRVVVTVCRGSVKSNCRENDN